MRGTSDERGSVNPLLIAAIILAILLVMAAGGFIWAYSSMVNYRDNANQMADSAATKAKNDQQKSDAASCEESKKSPYLEFQSSSTMGSIRFKYPKSWSSYTSTDSDDDTLEVYFAKNNVPKVEDDVTPYALRLKVVNQSYSTVVANYKSKVSSEDSNLKASTVKETSSDKSTYYNGIRFDGQISENLNGSIVLFPVRDKTLELYCDSSTYMDDFKKILDSLDFQP